MIACARGLREYYEHRNVRTIIGEPASVKQGAGLVLPVGERRAGDLLEGRDFLINNDTTAPTGIQRTNARCFSPRMRVCYTVQPTPPGQIGCAARDSEHEQIFRSAV